MASWTSRSWRLSGLTQKDCGTRPVTSGVLESTQPASAKFGNCQPLCWTVASKSDVTTRSLLQAATTLAVPVVVTAQDGRYWLRPGCARRVQRACFARRVFRARRQTQRKGAAARLARRLEILTKRIRRGDRGRGDHVAGAEGVRCVARDVHAPTATWPDDIGAECQRNSDLIGQ